MIEPVIAGDLQRRDHGAGVTVLAGVTSAAGQPLRIGVDRIAEQHQLHQRHEQHHGEGHPVAPHLDRLPWQTARPGGGTRSALFMPVAPAHEMDERILEPGLPWL
jgi:hypothetical protein